MLDTPSSAGSVEESFPSTDRATSQADTTLCLLALARAGDSHSIDILYARYFSRLRRWASGRLPSRIRGALETQDLVQDTLLRSLPHLAHFDPRHPGALLAYLRRSFLNRVRDELRRVERHPMTTAFVGREIARDPSPLEAAIGSEAGRRYDQALSRLRTGERDAIVGRVEMGYSYGELAAVLRKPSAEAARKAAVRAQARLASELRLSRPRHAHRTSGPSAGLDASQALPPPPGGPAAIGRRGHLELIELIGEGTFGEVYRSWDDRLHCEVAVKLLRRHVSADRASTLSEARLLASIRHPNVVRVYDADTIDGRAALCMELVRGRTLKAIVDDHGALAASEAAAVGAAVCHAIAAVHAAGLLHGDVTARNVMREEGGRIVLMDFGTGRTFASLHRWAPKDLKGTPLYMAPEVLAGAPPSVSSDLYSLGTLLYYLVSGSFPVSGRTLAEVVRRHRRGQLVPLDARLRLPHAYLRAVEAATAPAPAARLATSSELLTLLLRVAGAPPSRPADSRG